jgi:segregation and condensation protein B
MAMSSISNRPGSEACSSAPTAAPESASEPARLVEALLFSGGTMLAPEHLSELTRLGQDQITETIAQLNQQYYRQGRPYEIRQTHGRYEMILRPKFAGVVRRLHGRSREVRLSVAAIEVLALIAYRQPVTLQTIDTIRGVDSGPIVRQLVRRNLIEFAELEASSPRTAQYRTTKRFLSVFHLNTLDDLPRVQDLDRA